jgi:hypothetical protein
MRGALKKKILRESAERRWRDELDDMYDVIEVEQRMANDNGVRYTLEEVMAEFGITRADLDAVGD